MKTIKQLTFNQIMSLATLYAIVIYVMSLHGIEGTGFWWYRKAVVLFTGILAFVLMSMCMIFTIRSHTLEKLSGGLDKMMYFHKWLAINSFIIAIIHWISSQGIKFLFLSGIFNFPPRTANPHGVSTGLSLAQLTTPAKLLGEYSFYFIIAFVLSALLSKIPYLVFQKIHRFIAFFYVFIALHSLILLPASWWSTPAAYLILVLAIGGTYGAFSAIFKIHHKKNSYHSKVNTIKTDDTGIVSLELAITDKKDFKSQAGQFIFIDFKPIDGAHPFTIASITSAGHLCCTIKPSGHFTNKMATLIKPEQPVVVEGPYGCFDFEDNQPNQVWIAGGIGIAPFIARLQALSLRPSHLINDKKIDLWYSTRYENQNHFPAELDKLCKQANVTLHRVITENGQRLEYSHIVSIIGHNNLSRTSVWFCGPTQFGQTLSKQLTRLGLPKTQFHRERFNFR